MYVGLQIETIYKDVHLVEVRISAWNGAFGGVTRVYLGLNQLGETPAKLRGFPSDHTDVREVTFGAFGPKIAGGAVSMRFYCADRAGHAYVDSKIESEYDSKGKAQYVTCSIPIEAAAVDSFVSELDTMVADRAGQAQLKGAVRPD